MPAPLFKRWAPPTPVALPSRDQTADSLLFSSETVAESTPTKKSKHKKRNPDEGVATSPTVQQYVSSPAPEAEKTPMVTPKSIKKPKKRAREIDAAEQSEETSKKHKSILSKFEKVSKLAQARGQLEESEEDEESHLDEELHDLQPMPQPAPVPEPVFEPTFSTLPTWLARPATIEASQSASFAELGVNTFFAKKLEKQGFSSALAVQTALLPMLHPGFDQHIGDICVSAKTGSGKTLAYLLPIIEALKDRAMPILSAVIVVPTRQLVNQALQVAEELCAGTKIKVGTALGNVAFATEQKQLVKLRAQYDPKAAKELYQRASEQFQSGLFERGGMFNDLKAMPVDHVPRYDFGVDILICTPGRLVEHIEHTTGFLLSAVRWLVIDEADQLLNQSFQGWATVLMDALHGETPADFMSAQERLRKRELDANSIWSVALPARRQLTKVVLSATMEKDLTKLGTLRLRRPKLVVVQDESTEVQPLDNEENVFELPSTLEEFAVHVADGSNKPLHLLHVLLNHVFPGVVSGPGAGEDSSDSDSSSDSSSEDESNEEQDESISRHVNRVLIFTKSTESASRLSHLLALLEPSFKPYLKTMTRALTADASRKLLKSFSTGAIKILIASDAASRGLDIPSITHVINYDIPTSITSYVHRVGRTARAGKNGQAWTLFTKAEAAWFLKQVAKGDSVKRGHQKVKRMDWKESVVTADGKKKAYRSALKELESAATGSTDA